METEIIDKAVSSIREKTGVDFTIITYPQSDHTTLDLVFKNKEIVFLVEFKNYVATHHVAEIAKKDNPDHPIIVLAEHIAPPARVQLRKKGIAYLEANGNAFVNEDETTIFIDGNSPVREIKPVTNRAFTKTGLKAVFHLLNDKEAITRTYRQLAEQTGIALGNIKYIIDGLEDAGFILQLDKRKMALKNKKGLLERWIAGYRETLKPDLFKGAYRIWVEKKRNQWQDINVKDLNMQWGGEAAGELLTNYLTASELTVYTPAFTGAQANALGVVPDKNGDVLLYEKFWRESGDVLATTPFLLVYADLIITEDPRCIETANIIYEEHLKDQIETN